MFFMIFAKFKVSTNFDTNQAWCKLSFLCLDQAGLSQSKTHGKEAIDEIMNEKIVVSIPTRILWKRTSVLALVGNRHLPR